MKGIITGSIDSNLIRVKPENELLDIEYNQKEGIPYLMFEQENGILLIKGKSYSDDVENFYDHLISLLDRYEKKEYRSLSVYFYLEVADRLSTSCIRRLIDRLQKAQLREMLVKIRWYYSSKDAEIQFLGESLQDNSTLDFKMISVNV